MPPLSRKKACGCLIPGAGTRACYQSEDAEESGGKVAFRGFGIEKVRAFCAVLGCVVVFFVACRFLPAYCAQHVALTHTGEERDKSEKTDKLTKSKVP
jgi:hypothetical protein